MNESGVLCFIASVGCDYNVTLLDPSDISTNFSNETCDDDYLEDISIKITTACAPFTVVFNALVLVIAFKFIDIRGKVNQYFVVSMTFADMVYGMNYMATRPFVESIPESLCRPYWVINWVCQIATTMFLMFLNIDKFISLTFPLRYHSLVTERKIVRQVVACWCIILVYALASAFQPLLTLNGNECTGVCKVRAHPINYAFMTFICYICPMVISLIISIYVFVLAQHKTRWVPDFPDSQVERRRERKRLYKRIFFVFSSTIWTAVTSLPYRLGSSAFWLCGLFSTSCGIDWAHQMVWAFMCILPLGSVGNPLITIITQRAYRQRVIFLWSIFIKRVHGPKICIPLSYIAVRRKSKSEDESTKVVEMMSNDDLSMTGKRRFDSRKSTDNAGGSSKIKQDD